MKFTAEKLDLDLELITLTGEEISLQPKKLVNGKVAGDLIKKWKGISKADVDDPLKEVTCAQLAEVYPKKIDWWLENFDPGTLNAILKHVAETIGGVLKKSTS